MRDENGRFVKGESGNPKGRAPRRTEQEYLDVVKDAVSLADMKEIAKRAVAQAKRGDPRARQWVSDYILGPAQQTVKLGGTDGGAIEHIIRVIRDDNRALDSAADRDADAGTGN